MEETKRETLDRLVSIVCGYDEDKNDITALQLAFIFLEDQALDQNPDIWQKLQNCLASQRFKNKDTRMELSDKSKEKKFWWYHPANWKQLLILFRYNFLSRF